MPALGPSVDPQIMGIVNVTPDSFSDGGEFSSHAAAIHQGRKLAADSGKHVMAFFEMVKTFIKENEGNEALKKDFLDPLKESSKHLQSAGMFFMQNGMKNPNAALAGSYDFMHLFGHVCIGLMWAKMAKVSHAALEGGTSDEAFYKAKLKTGRYYMSRRLPATAMHLKRIESGADPVMELEAELF